MKVLDIQNLVVQIKNKEIIKSISFSVEEWEVFGFLWPNGAGKTTTMKTILGLLQPTSGGVEVLGGQITSQDIRASIGFMPENTYLYKHITGKEFLELNGGLYGLSPAQIAEKVPVLLKKVGLENEGDTRLAKYSKGMLQRIGLAQAVMNDPKVVFLDEPMSGLDPIGRRHIKELIAELKSQGTTVFLNTHILADVQDVCDRFAILNKWELLQVSDIESIWEKSLEDVFIEVINGSK